jgi:hypothetical protein
MALTRRVLEKAALSASQCEKILAEAREGELRLAENGDVQQRLRRLLNLDAALPPVAREEHGPAMVSPRTNRRKLGIRDPKRDPVGERQPAYA